MRYRKRWWQFWLPECPCPNKVEISTHIDDCMPSGGPGSKGSFGMAVGDWKWHIDQCPDCGKITRWGHWA